MRTREWYFRTIDVTQMTGVGETRDLLINSLLLTGLSRKTEEDLNVLVWNGLQDTVLESKSTEQCASVCLYVY